MNVVGFSDLAGAAIEMVGLEISEFKLERILEKIREDYDYILIDCPPSLGILTVNALVASDEVLIPVQCEYLALEGLEQLLATVNLVKNNLGKNLKIAGAVLTMYNRNGKLSREVGEEVKGTFPGYVFDTIIPRSSKLAECPKFGKTILEYSPESMACLAYLQLADEIISLEQVQRPYKLAVGFANSSEGAE